MNRLFVSMFALAACGALPPNPNATLTLPAGHSSLVVSVEDVKQGKGPIFCDLFNAGDGFPGPSPIIGGSLRLEADATRLTCTFDQLPAGTYAVSVIQDENANGKLDTSVFGAPIEGYGVSNNVIPATSAPRWSDSQFSVDGDAPADITVTLHR